MLELIVNDMTCGHCQSVVTKAIKGVDSRAKVDVDLQNRIVRIETGSDLEEMRDALSEAGYPAVAKA